MKKYIFPIIITIISIFIIFTTIYLYKNNYSSYKNFDYKPNYNEIIYYKLKGLSNFYIDYLDKEYLIWKRSKNREISKEYIESIVYIKASDLNNKYCTLMENEYSEDNVIACIETYYNEIGIYQLLKVEYEEIFKIYKYANNNTVRQKAITILYLIDDLKHLTINSKSSSSKFYENYKNISNEIENQLEDMYKKV